MGQGSYRISENKEAKAWFASHSDEEEHTTYALGLLGEEFVKTASATGKPFCFSINFKAPHSPYWNDPHYKSVYEGKRFTKPENYGPQGAEHIPAQPKAGRPQSKGGSWVKNYD